VCEFCSRGIFRFACWPFTRTTMGARAHGRSNEQWHFLFVCEWSTDHTHHLLGEGETTTTTQECQCQFQQFT
jgi:hypothetical protein